MDFANRKGGSKESVADKARRERNERAAAKKTADEAEIQQHAADVVTRGLRRFLDAQKAFDKLAKCLDRVLTDKPKSKLNLDTANANVNRIDHADHAEANVDTLNLSITRPRDLLLLLHLAQTVAAKLRTAQRKAENEVRLTNLCSALVAASSPSGTFVLSPFIANANYLATVSSKCISDLINTCLQRVIGENGLQKQSQSSYASGSETLLLLQALDGSKWVTNSSDSNALDSIKKSLVNDSRLWKSVHESILSKVKLIIALSKSHKSVAHTLSSADEKSVKKINLWINAMIHLSFLILATPFVGSSEKWICFSNYIMSVPLLIPTLDKSGLELWRKNSAFKNCLQVLSTDKFYKDDSFAFINGELSVFVIGNLVELFRSNSKPNDQPYLTDFIHASSRLLQLCSRYVKSKSTNVTRFHPVLQWYSGPMLDVPGEFHNKLVETLSFFWSRQFIQAAFSPVLSYLFPPPSSIFLKTSKLPNVFAKLGFRTPESSNNNQFQFSSKLEESQTTTISISILSACNLFHQLTRTLRNSKTHILTSLSWTPTLIPRLWRLLNIVGPNQAGTKLFLTPAAARAPHREPFALVLQLFCESCCILFMTLDDVDIYERQYPFVIEELAALSSFLNQFCFNAVWNAANPSGTFVLSSFVPVDGGINDAGGAVVEAAQKLLGILYDQSSRRPLGNSSGFSADGERVDDWIVRTVSGRDIVADIKNGDQRTIAVLNSMPQCIPFAQRVEVFRYMVKADKLTIGEAPMDIIVRRRSVLEDGLKQLGKISPSQLKQTIKVRFMNELGLYEAGIDQNGVFKEFLEDICKSAFATDFGLFRTTDDGNCVPSISSGIHENHLTLLEFVGKIFSKALYEGIVIDIPFATFVYAKMLGRLNFFEDLPSLDAELYKNLVFLKHYEGDVSDLGLTFTIDENIFGAIKSKEIKPGGAAIEVNNENKFEYIHIMSDYKLNQECKAQFKALVGGFRSIMPEKYIRFFSPQELQTLMSGENVDFDIADLRKYTRYEAGYFDQHATIRLFWQVVTELSPKEKNAFLKFVTSCSNPPVGGFKHLEPPFTIRFVAAIASDDADANPASQFGKALGSFFGVGKDATRLPTASTCFNVLKLPAYQKKSSLKTKLVYAIKSGAGFELS